MRFEYDRSIYHIYRANKKNHNDFHGFLSSTLGDIEENPRKMARGFLYFFFKVPIQYNLIKIEIWPLIKNTFFIYKIFLYL